MKLSKKRIASVLMALVMVLSLLPTAALAAAAPAKPKFEDEWANTGGLEVEPGYQVKFIPPEVGTELYYYVTNDKKAKPTAEAIVGQNQLYTPDTVITVETESIYVFAVAQKDGVNSDVAKCWFDMKFYAPAPNVASGCTLRGTELTFTTSSEKNDIFYEINPRDGVTADEIIEHNQKYTTPIVIDGPMTVAAVSKPIGYDLKSEVVTRKFTVYEEDAPRQYMDFTLNWTDYFSEPCVLDSMELSGGRVVSVGGQKYLEFDIRYGGIYAGHLSSPITQDPKNYIRVKVGNGAAVNVLEDVNLGARFVAASPLESNSRMTDLYCAARYPLNIEPAELAGQEVTIEGFLGGGAGMQTYKLTIGEVKNEPTVEPFVIGVTVGKQNYKNEFTVDGNDRKLRVENEISYAKVNPDFDDSAVAWHYTFGDEAVTAESASVDYDGTIFYKASEDPNAKDDSYVIKLNVRPYDKNKSQWLTESKTYSIKIGARTNLDSFTANDEVNHLVNVGMGKGEMRYDTRVETEIIKDQAVLNDYAAKVKALAGESYGDFTAFKLKLVDKDGNPAMPEKTGDWGEGYYYKANNPMVFGPAADLNVTVQDEIWRYLEFRADNSDNIWPDTVAVYHVNADGSLTALPMYTTHAMVLQYGQQMATTFGHLLYMINPGVVCTSWDWAGGPDGTYIVMEKPVPHNVTDFPNLVNVIKFNEGEYLAPVKILSAQTDMAGQAIEKWFTTDSVYQGNIAAAQKGLKVVHVSVTDGNPSLYIELQEHEGRKISAVNYDGNPCDVIETYTAGGKTYPKLIKIALKEEDQFKAYVPIQIAEGSSLTNVTLNINYLYGKQNHPTDVIQLTAPVISTADGKVTYANEDEATVSITANAQEGAIYYTTDGTTPTEGSTQYTEPFTLNTSNTNGESFTVKALLKKTGFADVTSELVITFNKEGMAAESVAAPAIEAYYDYAKDGNGDTAATGFYKVDFTSATEDATFYYTTDGSVPTRASAKYDGKSVSVPALTDGKATVIKVLAVKDGFNDAAVAEKTIQFSTDWLDNLEEGKEYEVPVDFVNLSVYVTKGIKQRSMGAGAVNGPATLHLVDGKPVLDINLQTIYVGSFIGNMIQMWYFEGNDNDDGMTYAVKFGKNTQEGAIKAPHTLGLNKQVETVHFPVQTNCERIYAGLETDVDFMGKQPVIVWADYDAVIEAVTGKAPEAAETVAVPTINAEKVDGKDAFTITITADPGASVQYAVANTEGDYKWIDYTEPFTVSGTDAVVKDNKAFVVAKASVNGKTSDLATSYLVFTGSNPGGGGSSAPEDKIEDGNYYVNIELVKQVNDDASMGDVAFDNNRKALVTVKNGEVTKVQMGSNPVKVGTVYSAITEVKVDGKAVTPLATASITTSGHTTTGTYEYLKAFSFVMPSDGQPGTRLAGSTYIPVAFLVPDTPMGTGFMDARLKFNWDSATETDDKTIQGNTEAGRGTNPNTGDKVADVELLDQNTGIKLNTDTEALDANVEMEITKPASGKDFETAKKAMADVKEDWALYKITTTLKNKEVQPDGSVTISIPCGDKGLTVYRINESGRKVPIKGGSVKNGYYVFNTSSLGLFAIVGEVLEGKAPTRFTDVPADFWAYDSIETVVKRGLFNGNTKTTFNPQGSMTRAQFVSVLGRLAGVDANGSGKTSFTDVPADMYYAPYVNWAVENGITLGVTETSFLPDRAISRQEMAVFLARYCSAKKIDLKDGKAPVFTDEAAIGGFAKDAVAEVSAAGLLQGRNDGSFGPRATATRAHVATLMARFIQGYSL